MRIIGGLLVILVGVAWLLNNLGMTTIPVTWYVFRLWPLIFVYWGVSGVLDALRQRGAGLVAVVNAGVAAAGLLLLANNFGWLQIGLGDIFRLVLPILVILAGISLLRTARGFTGGTTHWAILSGLEVGKVPFKLEDSSFLTIMGGGSLDLTEAEIDQPEVNLYCLAIMGGWEIKVPQNLRVDVMAESLLGGCEIFGEGSGGIMARKHVPAGEGDGPVIRLRAQVLMGGVEVKRV